MSAIPGNPDGVRDLLDIRRAQATHWVGDGFPVRTALSPQGQNGPVSPFLLLDHAGPAHFPPTGHPRGVGEHPHRGFETVTIVYSGEVEHRDSAGGGGLIGPGDVQWMTAASGVVHEEMHGPGFARRGGTLEMVQLWVNLPAASKKGPPRYQAIAANTIPEVPLGDGAGVVRVIAGSFGNQTGPATTHTPVNLWDMRAQGGHHIRMPVPNGHNAMLFMLAGEVELVAGGTLESGDLAIFGQAGDSIAFNSKSEAKLLILTGEPIREPVVAYGPFVMNTQAEIREAFADYHHGRMGQIGSRQ